MHSTKYTYIAGAKNEVSCVQKANWNASCKFKVVIFYACNVQYNIQYKFMNFKFT